MARILRMLPLKLSQAYEHLDINFEHISYARSIAVNVQFHSLSFSVNIYIYTYDNIPVRNVWVVKETEKGERQRKWN